VKPAHGARVDSNQPAIVAALRAAGCKVQVLDSRDDNGVPDLLVGFLGTLSLLENKSRKGRLSPGQVREREEWAKVGVRVHLCRSELDALRAVGADSASIAAQRAALRPLVPLDPASRIRPNVRSFR
jgi:hypothetical protein